MLLRAEKNNQLPSFFRHGPVKAVHKMESESTVRNDSGVELRRNSAFFKNCHTPGRFQQLGRKRRNGNAFANVGKEHGKGTSDAEVNMENERVDVGYKDQEIRQHQEMRGPMRQIRRSARFKGFVLN